MYIMKYYKVNKEMINLVVYIYSTNGEGHVTRSGNFGNVAYLREVLYQ